MTFTLSPVRCRKVSMTSFGYHCIYKLRRTSVDKINSATMSTKVPFSDKLINRLFISGDGSEHSIIRRYKDAELYDKETDAANYNGPRLCAELFLSLNLDRNTRILDMAGGTGPVARFLKKSGYHNIDVLDASEDMMNSARQDNIYKNYYRAYLSTDNPMPIADDTYDAMVMSGAFAPGQLTSDLFEDLIRVVKPGGHIVWSMRCEYVKEDCFQDFYLEIDRLCREKQWRKVRMDIVPNYIYDEDALLAIFTVV